MGSYANLLVDCTAGLAVLSVNRPDKLNALNGDTLDAPFAAATSSRARLPTRRSTPQRGT